MEVKPLLELIKRAHKSKFNKLVLNDRMLIQCYDANHDSDSGFHYILYIPTTDEYKDKFYNKSLIIYPESILNTYKDGHDEVLAIKKEKKISNKDINEFVDVIYNDDMVELVFQHVIQDKLIASNTVGCKIAEVGTYDVDLIIRTLFNLHDRIKPNGLAVRIDGYKAGYYYKIMNHAQITYSKIDIGGTKVRIPLFKSMLTGIKMPDEFLISLQETVLKDIYIYTIQITNKGLTDQYISYIINF
jgi:hypothetical protein